MKTRIAITGATGFLGKYLVSDLLEDENIELFLFSNSLEKLKLTFTQKSNIHFIETDYSYNSLKNNFSNYNAVIHLAAKRMETNKNAIADYWCNVEFTENLLQVCDEDEVEVLVFTSSISVYDSFKNHIPFSEKDTPYPQNAYGISKLACENLSSKFKTKMVILRLGQLMGWGEREEFMFTQSLNKIIRDESVTLWGNGGGERDYLYTKDAVHMIKIAIEKKHEGIFNVGSGVGISFKELIETMAAVFGNSKSLIFFDTTKTENTEIRKMCIDKVYDVYRWKPLYSLKKGFVDMKNSKNHQQS